MEAAELANELTASLRPARRKQEGFGLSNTKVVPHSGPVFDAMMREVDAKLLAEGVLIADRPLLAAQEVSTREGVPIPLGGEPARLPPDLRPYAPLGAAIRQWYNEIYGDRLKVDMTPGISAVRLDGDIYTLKIPRIFGSVGFVMSRRFLPEAEISRGPATCNVVQLVNALTPAKAASLSDGSLDVLAKAFERAMKALYTMEATGHELVSSARGDVLTAVSCLLYGPARFGDSKWASLQAAEKVLKAAIDLQGASYKRTHILEDLCATLSKAGIRLEAPALLMEIQCTPAIRYGEEPCTEDEALAAHHASLDLVNRLRESGAKFELGLG